LHDMHVECLTSSSVSRALISIRRIHLNRKSLQAAVNYLLHVPIPAHECSTLLLLLLLYGLSNRASSMREHYIAPRRPACRFAQVSRRVVLVGRMGCMSSVFPYVEQPFFGRGPSSFFATPRAEALCLERPFRSPKSAWCMTRACTKNLFAGSRCLSQ